MEENNKKKKKFPLIIILTMMIACCTVFAVLCATGIMTIPTSEGDFVDLHTAALIKKASHVEDEATLRELLLLKKELSIVVTKDIKIDETFIVKGNKTLYGNATISADVAGEYRTMYIFDVQPGASLTMNGLVLDGDGTADGINVGQDAELTYLSGTIQYMRYGIQTNGKVHFEGGLIQHSTQAGILSSYRSKVYVNGGYLYNANSHLIQVDTNGYVEINEGADLSVCRGDAVFNAGTLHVYGGTIHDTVTRAINTEGELHMEYKGTKKDGYIEMYNIGSIAVRMNAHDDCYISDVHAVTVGTNGVFTTDLRSNGKTTVEDCIFDTCAIVEGNGMSVSRKVKIKDVTILNSQGGGINVRENGNVTIDGVIIDGTKGDALTIGSDLEAKNIHISNVQANNLEVIGEVEATISDSVLGKSKRTSIYMRKDSALTLDNVEVQGVLDEGMFNFHVNEGSVLNLKGDTVITGATRVAICLYKNTTLNMEDGKICDIKGTDNGAAVWVREEGAVFNMTGGTICNNTTTGSSGAVYVANKATFNMSGGTLSGNSAKYSGGAVQVQGVMNFSGGTIDGNKSETTGGGINVGNNTKKDIYGKLNMTGGTISNNTSKTNGGGISVSGKTTANISGGTIKGNKAESIGNGVADNGYLTISKNAYITGNDVGIVDRSIVLKIAGSSLSKHSKSDPLLVTPHFKTKPNQYVVIECDSESASAAMLNSYIASGSKVYTLLQKESEKQKIIVNVNEVVMDLDTTGAETVYVTNFEQLKEAVQTTKTKRNIVLGADIVMESLITVPAGTTVKITDDGHTRILTRNSGHTTLFFETWYGTGLVLEGTSEGKLILDGQTSGEIKAKNISPLVKARGTTAVTNATFKNNGQVGTTTDGALLFNEYGQITISNSTFANGYAARGGAIYVASSEAVVTDCTFINNTSTGNGGAIYSAMNTELTLVGTDTSALFKGNTSAVNGGAICIGTGTVDIKGYTFTENSAVNGGAIRINTDKIVATIADSVFTKNTADDEGGAVSSASTLPDGLTVKGSTFEENSASGNGGALATRSKQNTIVKDTTFSNNSTEGQGGAIITYGKELTVADCEFISNTSEGNGGAVYSGSNCITTIATSTGAVFEGNKSTTGTGGAIGVGTGHLVVTGYTFDGNVSEASDGGAIRLNKDEITAEITDTVFVNNKAVSGGAISNAATTEAEDDVNLLVKNCIFGRENEGNTATSGNGGAINSAGSVAKIENTTFVSNVAKQNGGAIYNGSDAVLTLTGGTSALFKQNESQSSNGGGAINIGSGIFNVDGYSFEGNTAASQGGAIRMTVGTNESTISNSIFIGNNSGTSGGAIYKKGPVTVTGSTFTSNTAGSVAGAINSDEGKITIQNTNFTSNIATSGKAGALQVYGTDAVAVIEVTDGKNYSFSGNKANTDNANDTSSSGYFYEKLGGGAIFVASEASLTVTDYKFTDNEAVEGGAIKTVQAAITSGVTRCEFTNNQATYKYGGAICNYGTSGITITDSTFGGEGTETDQYALGNKAVSNGGAIYHAKGGQITLNDTNASVEALFKNNKASVNGGAICIGSGTLNITGYEFVGNNAQDGGAIKLNNAGIAAIITGSAFGNNRASSEGGAIYNDSQKAQGLNVSEVSFTGNTSGGSGGAIFAKRGGTVLTTQTGKAFSGNIAGSSTSKQMGGAIYADIGTISITGYTFTDNHAYSAGGAVRLAGSITTATFTNCTFTGNDALSGHGGAISNNSTSATENAVTITDTKFDSNKAVYGGAIHNRQSDLNLVGTKEVSAQDATAIFTGNEATTTGGAIYMIAGKLNVTKYQFVNNKSASFGGAICHPDDQVANAVTMNISSCKFDFNTATTGQGGALYHNKNDVVEITNTNFTSNKALAGHGGAVCSEGGTLTVANCDFTSNTASGDGGAYRIAATGHATFTNGTFSSNSASGKGGAVKFNTGTLVITNYTFTGNTVNGTANAIDTNNRGDTHYTQLIGCTINTSEITGKGVK